MEHDRTVPVRVYETDRRVNVAAPLPGLEPTDITVRVQGQSVRIHGGLRGPHQDERRLTLKEWTVGPYDREIRLPAPVNGALTNATYGNGILVLAMPRMPHGAPGIAADIRLTAIDSTRGERVGHVSRDVRPMTTDEHLSSHPRHRAGSAAPHTATGGI